MRPVQLAWPIRSLTLKLTLAFLLVGVIGAVLVAVLVEARTRFEFNQYLSARDQTAISDALSSYYAAHGSWDGVREALAANSQLSSSSREITLVDAQHAVVLGSGPFAVGRAVPPDSLGAAQTVQADGQVVGYVLFRAPPPDGPLGGPPRGPRPPPEAAFVQRLTWASAVSAGVAALIALILGSLLARTLTRPIRELTAATKALASGQLDHRVAVRSRDEVGALATSFNQMSADLAQATRARRQMTADLAHDLRTPLSILRGYTEGLQDGRLQGTPSLYQIMHGEVVHLQRLVDDLRLLSLADAGALSLNLRPVDPAALLERTGLAYFVQAEEQGITLRVEAPESLPSVSVDTDRMTQVLNNLVSNALRYTKQGEIVLLGSSDHRRVTLQVRDTGAGIAPEDLPFVFDRFYRADPARRREDNPASGLGLAIARAIVEAHGGTITADSILGRGTTISIALPALSPQPQQPQASDAVLGSTR